VTCGVFSAKAANALLLYLVISGSLACGATALSGICG